MGLLIYLFILAFIFGACMGSFINCAADRYVPQNEIYVKRESIVSGRSHCPICGSTLGALELIPIVSYISLGGKCRHCKAQIPIRCLQTEILGGVIFLSILARFGLSALTAESMLIASLLYAVALIDLNSFEIPDGLLKAMVVVFILFLPTHDDMTGRIADGLIGLAALGGGLLVISLIMDYVLKRESLGGGDIKLFGVLGLLLGPAVGLLTLIISCIVGLVFAFASRQGKNEFPFGPSIAAAAFIAILFGQDIIDLYLSIIL